MVPPTDIGEVPDAAHSTPGHHTEVNTDNTGGPERDANGIIDGPTYTTSGPEIFSASLDVNTVLSDTKHEFDTAEVDPDGGDRNQHEDN